MRSEGQKKRVSDGQKLCGALVALLALGVGWSKYSIGKISRTPQTGRAVYSSKSPGEGFVFKVVERANASHKYPTSVTDQFAHPGCKGAYKNRPGSPPLHIHVYDDELFEVVSGRMGYVSEGKEGILEKGQKALLPAGRPHTFWNAEPNETLYNRVTLINKSGKWSANERFFDQWGSNAYDHDGLDNVNPLQLLTMLKAGGIELAAPYPVRLFIWYVVCPLAEFLGYKGAYPEYIYP